MQSSEDNSRNNSSGPSILLSMLRDCYRVRKWFGKKYWCWQISRQNRSALMEIRDFRGSTKLVFLYYRSSILWTFDIIDVRYYWRSTLLNIFRCYRPSMILNVDVFVVRDFSSSTFCFEIYDFRDYGTPPNKISGERKKNEINGITEFLLGVLLLHSFRYVQRQVQIAATDERQHYPLCRHAIGHEENGSQQSKTFGYPRGDWAVP